MAPKRPAYRSGRRQSLPPSTLRSRNNSRSKKNGGRIGKLFGISIGSLFLLFFLVIALFVSGVSSVYAYFTADLPDPTEAQILNFETTKIYDRNGVLLYEMFDRSEGRRTHVSLEEISPFLVEATIAAEDAGFYENPGVDFKAILRAVYTNITGQGYSGASTITQQLVRTILLQNEKYDRTVSRKIREALLAVEFSRRYSKDEILDMFLNEMYYGNMSYGIEAASQSYFGKLSKDLDLAESALLAGLLQAPSAYDPTVNPDLAKQRQGVVLGLMVKHGYIDEAQAKEAFDEPLHFVKQTEEKILAPHFVRYVQQVLEDKYGPDVVNRGGLSVYTTLDLRYQDLAQDIARKHIAEITSSNAHNAALVAMKPKTGEILAMLGSVDYYDESIDGQVNVATSPNRQPGSAFKPIAYATAFQKGWTPGTMIVDAKTVFKSDPYSPPYEPSNYDNRFHGPMLPREALANSFNIPAVKAIQYAGLHDTIATAHAMGVTGLQNEALYGLSLSLGGGEVSPLDLTTAFATFANGGLANKPVALLKVVDTDGNVIDQFYPEKAQPKRAISSQIAYIITSFLSDNNARAPMFGLDSPLKLSRPAAAKTGTTNDYKDGWTVGFTPYLAVGVWTGNSNGEVMNGEPGVVAAAPIWHNFMEAIFANSELENELKDSPDDQLQMDFTEPPGLVKVTVCALNGKLPSKACPKKVTEYFVAGTEPKDPQKDTCQIHKVVKICKESGKLANPFCPPDQVEEKAFVVPTKEMEGWGGDAAPPAELCDIHGPGVITGTVPLNPIDIPPPKIKPGQDFPGLDYSIASPTSGSSVSGMVPIMGTAYMDPGEFQFYKLEYGMGMSPSNWMLMSTTYPQPVMSGQLDTWNTDILDEGLYTIRLVVVNSRGNFQTPFKVRVYVERSKPTVKLVSPENGLTLDKPGEVKLEAQASSPAGISAVQFYVDDQLVGTATAAPYTMNWQATPGEHIVYAMAFTPSKRQATSERVTVTCAGEKQESKGLLGITSPANGSHISAATTTIMTSSDPQKSGIVRVEFYVDGARLGVSSIWPFQREWNTTPGEHEIMVIGYDAQGSEVDRSSIRVTVQ